MQTRNHFWYLSPSPMLGTFGIFPCKHLSVRTFLYLVTLKRSPLLADNVLNAPRYLEIRH
jgi:hypothetical protein